MAYRTVSIPRMQRDPSYTDWVRSISYDRANKNERVGPSRIDQKRQQQALARRRRRAAEKIARAHRKENRQ